MKISPELRRRMLFISVLITAGTGLITVFSVADTVVKLPVAITIFASGFAAGVALISYRQKRF